MSFEDFEIKKGKIAILDKINDTFKYIDDSVEIIIDPDGNTLFINDYPAPRKNMFLYGVIHMEDGTSLFLYKDKEK